MFNAISGNYYVNFVGRGHLSICRMTSTCHTSRLTIYIIYQIQLYTLSRAGIYNKTLTVPHCTCIYKSKYRTTVENKVHLSCISRRSRCFYVKDKWERLLMNNLWITYANPVDTLWLHDVLIATSLSS